MRSILKTLIGYTFIVLSLLNTSIDLKDIRSIRIYEMNVASL